MGWRWRTYALGSMVGLLAFLWVLANAFAAPLQSNCHGSPVASCVVRFEPKVKHSQRAVIWTQGCLELGCIGRELYWPVQLHKGINKIRLGMLAVAYRWANPRDAEYRFEKLTSVMLPTLDTIYIGVRRHSARGKDWLGPMTVETDGTN